MQFRPTGASSRTSSWWRFSEASRSRFYGEGAFRPGPSVVSDLIEGWIRLRATARFTGLGQSGQSERGAHHPGAGRVGDRAYRLVSVIDTPAASAGRSSANRDICLPRAARDGERRSSRTWPHDDYLERGVRPRSSWRSEQLRSRRDDEQS